MNRERLLAIAVATTINVIMVAILLTYPRGTTTFDSKESGVLVTFVERGPELKAAADVHPAIRFGSNATRSTTSRRDKSAATSVQANASPRAEVARDSSAPNPVSASPSADSLDLSLPKEFLADPEVLAREIGDPPNPVEYRSTRFNQHWIPEEKPIQHTWAFRSRTAKLLLSMTGALVEPCTEAERKRRDKRCFGAQYEGD